MFDFRSVSLTFIWVFLGLGFFSLLALTGLLSERSFIGRKSYRLQFLGKRKKREHVGRIPKWPAFDVDDVVVTVVVVVVVVDVVDVDVV